MKFPVSGGAKERAAQDGILRTLRLTVGMFSPNERRRGILVVVMAVLMALVETFGVASVMPFLAVLGSPELIHEIEILAWAYSRFDFDSPQSFLVALGVVSFLAIIIASGMKSLTHYVLNRYTLMRRHSISERLLGSYLRQPYSYFLDKDSAVLSKRVLSETDQLVTYVLKPAASLLGYGATLVVLVAFLVVINPIVAISVTAVVCGSYLVIYLIFGKHAARLGRDRVTANKARFKTAAEALGGIKDVKILGREEAYLQRFRHPSIRYSRLQTINSVVSEVPKYLIEAVGYGGIIALTLIMMSRNEDLGPVLAVLGVYAFAAYRLLPAAQHVYAAMAKLRFGAGVIDVLHADFRARRPEALSAARDSTELNLCDAIRFRGVSFRYPGAERLALDDVSLEFPANRMTALIGRTGAGKSTVVDLLLGLLTPSAGSITIDELPLSPTVWHQWRRSIGYVPQQIYLADASIAENIAFGVKPAEIDMEAVERAARAAQIHDFVVNQLPGRFDAVVGERGVKLSGGQRQRVGIARALYRDPQVLVLDEATSALDDETEAAVMRAIDALSGRKTIVMIAHRLSTIRNCDRVYRLEAGTVVTER